MGLPMRSEQFGAMCSSDISESHSCGILEEQLLLIVCSSTVCYLFLYLMWQVAEVIKEDLWPNPLKYFNNVRKLL